MKSRQPFGSGLANCAFPAAKCVRTEHSCSSHMVSLDSASMGVAMTYDHIARTFTHVLSAPESSDTVVLV